MNTINYNELSMNELSIGDCITSGTTTIEITDIKLAWPEIEMSYTVHFSNGQIMSCRDSLEVFKRDLELVSYWEGIFP